MSQIVEQYKNHSIWQSMDNLGPIIDQAITREGIDPSTIELLARIKSVLTFIGKRLAGADPFLMQPGPLDKLASSIVAATSEISHFISNGNTAHIQNANNQANSMLSFIIQINVPLTTDDFVAAKEAAENYRLGLDRILSDSISWSSQVSSEFNNLQLEIDDFANKFNVEREKIESLASNFQAKFSSSEDNRQMLFESNQNNHQQELDKMVNEYMAKRDNLLKDYTELVAKRMTDIDHMFEELNNEHNTRLKKLENNFTLITGSIRDEIFEHKRDVENLVGVIGNLAVTSGYQKTANEAKYTNWLWQAVTVASLISLIYFASNEIIPLLKNGFSWGGFGGRVFISLTFFILAAYAATQADKSQKVERKNRRLALELEAIRPFIASLPTDKQEDFILKIGDRSFGRNDENLDGLNEKSPATALDLLKSKDIQEMITEIIKVIEKSR